MRANPKVCKEVDEIANQFQWVSVVIKGTYDELKEPHNLVGRAHARMLLGQQHQFWLNALAERRAKRNDLAIDPLFFSVRALSMTGLRATGDGQTSSAF
jgi:nitroimidazol reductase NimA-like FMN-containing flavoprotein (pyridoxamine 5'-phosphate oxidase superfamily)